MAEVVKAPHAYPRNKFKVFLAGSIDNGAAEDWQKRVEQELADYDITILNPRRDDWDWTWEQSIDNPKFLQQVTWEQESLDDCDLIAMYFGANTKSPISLLEFGQYVATNAMIVYCPKEFWRKGNVDIVAERYGVKVYDDYERWLVAIKVHLDAFAHIYNRPA